MSVRSETTKAQNETIEEPNELNQINHDNTPRCFYHPSKEAEAQCDQCLKNICGVDMKKSGTIEVCESCFLEDAQDDEFGNKLVWPMFILPIALVLVLFIFVINT